MDFLLTNILFLDIYDTMLLKQTNGLVKVATHRVKKSQKRSTLWRRTLKSDV